MSARITHNPDQCGGRPCIRGMRIRVQVILELYAAEQSSEQILADFPDLEPEDLKAALAYAARENAALHGQTATASRRACPVDGAGVGVGLQRHREATEQLLLSWGSHRGRAAQARCMGCCSVSGRSASRAAIGLNWSGTCAPKQSLASGSAVHTRGTASPAG